MVDVVVMLRIILCLDVSPSFLSGKMISTGAKSTVKSIEQLQQTIDLLVNAKFIKPIKLVPLIQNIVEYYRC